mgnify:CR=1 FL=1
MKAGILLMLSPSPDWQRSSDALSTGVPGLIGDPWEVSRQMHNPGVFPAQAGIQKDWAPAFAGETQIRIG